MPFQGRRIRIGKRREGLLFIKKVLNRVEYLKIVLKKTSAQKRASLCLSGHLRASMTVEAAFVLPFFLFAFLNVISILEIYRLQSNMGAAMHMTAKEMAVCAYEYQALSDGDAGKAESLGLTYVYAANRVKGILGKKYLDNAPLKGGAPGIVWIRS